MTPCVESVLVLDSGEIVMNPGDVVVQLGNWHGWTNPRRMPSRMSAIVWSIMTPNERSRAIQSS